MLVILLQGWSLTILRSLNEDPRFMLGVRAAQTAVAIGNELLNPCMTIENDY